MLFGNIDILLKGIRGSQKTAMLSQALAAGFGAIGTNNQYLTNTQGNRRPEAR
jgi:hypothetical protein